MSRIPYLPQEVVNPVDVVERIRARRGGRLNHVDRTILHAPSFAHGWNEIAKAIRLESTLPPRLRELAICGVGILNGAHLEVETHVPEFIKAGGTRAQITAMHEFEEASRNTSLFDDIERAVLLLTLEMTRHVTVSASTFNLAKEHFRDDRQLVELVGTISFYNMVSRFVVALDIVAE